MLTFKRQFFFFFNEPPLVRIFFGRKYSSCGHPDVMIPNELELARRTIYCSSTVNAVKLMVVIPFRSRIIFKNEKNCDTGPSAYRISHLFIKIKSPNERNETKTEKYRIQMYFRFFLACGSCSLVCCNFGRRQTQMASDTQYKCCVDGVIRV